MEDLLLQHKCYRQAAHATMYYLLKQGKAGKYTPIDRSIMLPVIEKVSIEEQESKWGQLTANLGSMIVVSQVLLAAEIAENIQFSDTPDTLKPLLSPKTNLRRLALHYVASYMEEYYNNPSESRNMEFLKELSNYVEEQIKQNWTLVQRLAEKLEKEKTIPMKEVFDLLSQ